ncbi:MAG: hypothetical protein FJ197_07115 [Gammaproteobacteria bacterium]|nr:hypothetical protein [Gammaproteobacteria bacterium]
MSRPRKIDESLWEDSDEALAKDHVVERFFSQHERDDVEPVRRAPVPSRNRRRLPPADRDD